MIMLALAAQALAPTGVSDVDLQVAECRYMLTLPDEGALDRRVEELRKRMTRAEVDDLQRTCVIYWQGLTDARTKRMG